MNVEYRTIPGFEKYEISEYGVIRNKEKGNKIKHIRKGNAISALIRNNEGKPLEKPLQYFVALAWIPNPNNHPHAVRKDKNIDNNHYSNIVWSLKRRVWLTEEGKQCSVCDEFKCNSEFYPDAHGTNGITSKCSICNRFDRRGTVYFDIEEQPDYKIIPGFSRYAVNKEGNVVRLIDSQFVTIYDKGIALFVMLTDDNNNLKTLYIKELIGDCFLPKIGGLDYIYYSGNDRYNISLDKLHRSMSKKVLATHEGRYCSVCNKFLSWDYFTNDSYSLNNKNYICKDCNKEFNNSKIVFNKYNYSLTPEESPVENEDGFLEVKCASCGTYFEPTHAMVRSRVSSLAGTNYGESKLYCSDECKKNCPIFKMQVNFRWQLPTYPSKYENARSKEWRGMVLERDNYICQECGDTESLVAHHIIPVVEDFIISADIDNGITLCSSCHDKKHSDINGCSKHELGHLCMDIEEDKG